MALNKHLFSYAFPESFTSGIESLFFSYNGYISIIILVLSFLIIFYTERSNIIRWDNLPIVEFVQPAQKISHKAGGKETDNIISENHDVFFYSVVCLILLYLIIVAYGINPALTRFINDHYLLEGIVDLMIRYHILAPLALSGVFIIKEKMFDLMKWLGLFSLIFLSGFIRTTINAPLFDGTMIMIFLALVTIKKYLIKNAKLNLLFSLALIFAGCASSLLLTSTVQDTFLDPCDEDLPYILTHITGDGLQNIYSPNYSYHVTRIVSISLNRYSPEAESDYVIIDREISTSQTIGEYLENESLSLLYEGDRFILFKK